MNLNIAGFDLPSNSPAFLAVLAVHVPVGLAAVITGGVAMLSGKHRGRHTNWGNDLLLVSGRFICDLGVASQPKVVRGLSPIPSRFYRVRSGVLGTRGAAIQMGDAD